MTQFDDATFFSRSLRFSSIEREWSIIMDLSNDEVDHFLVPHSHYWKSSLTSNLQLTKIHSICLYEVFQLYLTRFYFLLEPKKKAFSNDKHLSNFTCCTNSYQSNIITVSIDCWSLDLLSVFIYDIFISVNIIIVFRFNSSPRYRSMYNKRINILLAFSIRQHDYDFTVESERIVYGTFSEKIIDRSKFNKTCLSSTW